MASWIWRFFFNLEYSNIGFRNIETDIWADFKSLYEPSGALRGQKNLKNGTWVEFKSWAGGDDGDDDSRPRAPWPGAFPSRTQE